MTKVGVALVATLVFAGTAAAATPAWTSRDAMAAARALAYPKPHARKVTCRHSGAAFKCTAVYRKRRAFVLAPGTEGGWTCAGRTLHTCHVLPKGFLSSAQVNAMGGLGAAAGYSSTGYIQEHFNGAAAQSASPCTQVGGTTKYQCAYSTPAVTVTVTYKGVKDGWTMTGTNS